MVRENLLFFDVVMSFVVFWNRRLQIAFFALL